jgi:hypothetical protein
MTVDAGVVTGQPAQSGATGMIHHTGMPKPKQGAADQPGAGTSSRPDAPHAPQPADTAAPDAGRIYDYLLGRSGDAADRAAAQRLLIRDIYHHVAAPVVPRIRAEVTRFFDGLDILPPGVVNGAVWRAGWAEADAGRAIFYGGLARKR